MVFWVTSDKEEECGFSVVFKFKLEGSVEDEFNNLFSTKAVVKKGIENGSGYFTVTDENEDLHKDWKVNTEEIRYTECYRANDCLVFCDNQGGHFCVVDANNGVVRRGFNYLTFGFPLDFYVFNTGIVNCYGEIALDDDAKEYWKSVKRDLKSFGAREDSIEAAEDNINSKEGFLFDTAHYSEGAVKEYMKLVEGYKVRY